MKLQSISLLMNTDRFQPHWFPHLQGRKILLSKKNHIMLPHLLLKKNLSKVKSGTWFFTWYFMKNGCNFIKSGKYSVFMPKDDNLCVNCVTFSLWCYMGEKCYYFNEIARRSYSLVISRCICTTFKYQNSMIRIKWLGSSLLIATIEITNCDISFPGNMIPIITCQNISWTLNKPCWLRSEILFSDD
jgi:hypothetical protein